MRRFLRWLARWSIALFLAWAMLVGGLYFYQRDLLFPVPSTLRQLASTSGLSNLQDVTLTTKDGEHLTAWYMPAGEGCPLIVFFHGNGETIAQETGRFARITEACFGLLAVDYRGYGGSSGHPTEAGLIEDAHAAYRYAAEQVGPSRVVIWGYSLGTGPAVAVAADSSIAKLVLEAPFSSLADVAADNYPFAPVRLLMKDPMRSIDRVLGVKAPVFVMHGDNDQVVPIRFGRRLYDAIPGPKTFKEYRKATHFDVGAFGLSDAFAFLKSGAAFP